MHCGFIYLLLSLMVIGLTQGSSHFSRDESSEDNKTRFNLASTFSGDIDSSRHHDRAHLNSQLYPDTAQQSAPQPSIGYGSADIDQASAHENGGSGLSTLGVVQPNPVGNRVPQVPSIYPALPGATPSVPLPGFPAPVVPGYPAQVYRSHYYTRQPGPAYPGVYPPQSPGCHGYFPQTPSYQLYPAQDHYDRSFRMNTEYKEDGVHTGPFEVLNNHNRPGYGSGFGGGYNGAFNRPGY